MKIEWLITNIIAVGFPTRSEKAFFGVIFDVFCRLFLVRGGRMEPTGHSLETQKHQLRSFHENIVDLCTYQLLGPHTDHERKCLGRFWHFWVKFGHFCGWGETWCPEDTIYIVLWNTQCILFKENKGIRNIQTITTFCGLAQGKFYRCCPICGISFDTCWPFFCQGIPLVTHCLCKPTRGDITLNPYPFFQGPYQLAVRVNR